MQTDIRMTILFYRNAILLKYLRKKEDRESAIVYSMRTFRASGTCETFLSFNLYVRSNLRGTDNNAERIRKVSSENSRVAHL